MEGNEKENSEQAVRFTLELSEEVELDLSEINEWYEERKNGLGELFFKSFERSLNKIQNHPESYRSRYKNLRVEKMKRFPYLIIFKVKSKLITVVKVVHGKRHPRIWKQHG